MQREAKSAIVTSVSKLCRARQQRPPASVVARELGRMQEVFWRAFVNRTVGTGLSIWPCPEVADVRSKGHDGVNVKPSSIQPVTPPIIIFTGKPSRERRNAALLAPLQCGPAQ